VASKEMNDKVTTNSPRTPNAVTAPRRKKGKARTCQLYIGGHTVHYIQANHSYGRPHRDGQLVDVEGNEGSAQSLVVS
jgi:hypothetical protein